MLTLLSPAKINLYLYVTGRRDDGYHSVSSLFQAISLFDTLAIEKSKEDLLVCDDPSLPTDSSNLVMKALNAFRQATGISTSYKFTLNKKIPIEAGLGGGSGNAATTLFGLNRLNGNPLTEEELITLGSRLGSDVAFFFSQGCAYVSGFGETIKNVEPPPLGKIHLIKPPFGLSTPLVFKKYDEGDKIDRSTHTYKKGSFTFMNDLEKAALALRPELVGLKEQLVNCGFDQVLMTGAGTSFYCLGKGKLPYFNGYRMFITEPIRRKKEEWYLPYDE